MIEYNTVMQPVRQLPRIISVAVNNDMREIQLSVLEAAKRGFALSNPLAGAQALMRVFQDRGRAMNAFSRIERVTAGWLKRSANSQKRLMDTASEWKRMKARGEMLASDMRQLLSRSEENFWEGEASARKNEQDKVRIQKFDAFLGQVESVIPIIEGSADLTTNIFALTTSKVMPALAQGQSAAMRAPIPKPSMFGLGTRVPQVAALFEQAATELDRVQSGFPWRIQELPSAMILRQIGANLRADAAK